MSSRKNEYKKQKLEEKDKAAMTTTTVVVAAALNDKITGILDLKDEVFQKVICSFLDRESICNLSKVKTLSNHFRIGKHFCSSHGTPVVRVSKQQRDEFQRRKGLTGTPWITSECPGCIDCSMGALSRLRCNDCNDFKNWHYFQTCAECHREACAACLALGSCDMCGIESGCCSRCFDGFYCTNCSHEFCDDCGIFLYCEKVGCEKRGGCAECMFEQHGITICNECNKAYCQDCCVSTYCEECGYPYCQDCRKSYYCDACGTSSCDDCCSEGAICDSCESYFCEKCTDGSTSGGEGWCCRDCSNDWM